MADETAEQPAEQQPNTMPETLSETDTTTATKVSSINIPEQSAPAEQSDFIMKEQKDEDPEDINKIFSGEIKDDDGEDEGEGQGDYDPLDDEDFDEGEGAEEDFAEDAEDFEMLGEEDWKFEDEHDFLDEEFLEEEEWGQGEESIKDKVKAAPFAPPLQQTEVSVGDFAAKKKDSGDIFAGFVRKGSYGSIDEVESGEGESREMLSFEEVEVESKVEEEEIIDRDPYYEFYRELLSEYPRVKMKNNYLQRKMAEYFKKRKMDHVLREADRIGDAEQKYFSKLDALWELKNTNDMQRNALTTELKEMKELRDGQYSSVVKNFEAMLAREKDIGTGLIFTKTAKEIPEKFLERLLRNQRLKSNEITDMRLKFIKLRNNIEEITAAIRAMDKIGENHTLMDYEQLKMENQNYSDKIDERDEELSRLREKCSGAIQTLAHLREKSSAMDIDIIDMSDMLEDAEMEKNEFREKVGQLKHQRDTLRAHIARLQEESGLVTKTPLLLDMEDTLMQIKNIKIEVDVIEQQYKDHARALAAIKHNIKVERDSYQSYQPRPVGHKKVKKRQNKGGNTQPKFAFPSLEKFHIDL